MNFIRKQLAPGPALPLSRKQRRANEKRARATGKRTGAVGASSHHEPVKQSSPEAGGAVQNARESVQIPDDPSREDRLSAQNHTESSDIPEHSQRNSESTAIPRCVEICDAQQRPKHSDILDDSGCAELDDVREHAEIPDVPECAASPDLRSRADAWIEALAPRNEAELELILDAVAYSQMRDDARRVMAARTQIRINNAGIAVAAQAADEVLALGEQLFHDPRGPLTPFPHDHGAEPETNQRKPAPPTARGKSRPVVQPLSPQRLVLRLQATAGGCQWLLDRWAELRDVLDNAWNWHPADKLKAVRLLGRQPLDAVDDRKVLTIFAACQAMEGQPGTEIAEILNELPPQERTTFHQRLKERGLDLVTPYDASVGRQTLIQMIDDMTTQIRARLDEHQARDTANAALTADAHGFDDSAEGDKLRRYEFACTLGIKRNLDMVFKLRREADRCHNKSAGFVKTQINDDDLTLTCRAASLAPKTMSENRSAPTSTRRAAERLVPAVGSTGAAAMADMESRADRSGQLAGLVKDFENRAQRDTADDADGTVARPHRDRKMSAGAIPGEIDGVAGPKNVHPPRPDPRAAGRTVMKTRLMPDLAGSGVPGRPGDLFMVNVSGSAPAFESPCWESG